MKKKTKMNVTNMTEGDVLRHLIGYAVPLLAGNLFNQVYNIMDAWVAGRNLGASGLAAIGATSSIYSFIMNFGFGMNAGFAVIVSRNFGADDNRSIRKAIAGSILICSVISIILTSLSLIFTEQLTDLMQTPQNIRADAIRYIHIIFMGMSGSIFYSLFSGIMRAVGNTKTPLLINVISCIINISMDMTVVPHYDLGVAGVAATTVLAQIIAAVLCGIYIVRSYKGFIPEKTDFHLDIAYLSSISSIGLSMAAMYCVVDLGNILFQSSNNALGERAITAESIATRISGVMMAPIGTLMSACSTFVSQNYGAGNRYRIDEGIRKSIVLEVIWGCIACTVILIIGKGLFRFMTSTTDSELIDMGYQSLKWCMPFFPVLGVLCVIRTTMQALGSRIIPILSSVIEVAARGWTAVYLIPKFGFFGTCIGVPITWTVMAVFLFVSYEIQKRKLFTNIRQEAFG